MLTALCMGMLGGALAALLIRINRLRTEVAWLTDEVAANLARVDQLAARVCAAEAGVRKLEAGREAMMSMAAPGTAWADLTPPTSVPATTTILSDNPAVTP